MSPWCILKNKGGFLSGGFFVKRSFDVAILGLEIGVLKLIKTVGPFKLNLKTFRKKALNLKNRKKAS